MAMIIQRGPCWPTDCDLNQIILSCNVHSYLALTFTRLSFPSAKTTRTSPQSPPMGSPRIPLSLPQGLRGIIALHITQQQRFLFVHQQSGIGQTAFGRCGFDDCRGGRRDCVERSALFGSWDYSVVGDQFGSDE